MSSLLQLSVGHLNRHQVGTSDVEGPVQVFITGGQGKDFGVSNWTRVILIGFASSKGSYPRHSSA
jgi:hypothetical protein